MLAAWTGSMDSALVRAVAAACLCPALWTSEQYVSAITAAGLRVLRCEDLTAKVVRTWEICRQRARAARAAVVLLPRRARAFVDAIELVLKAYTTGELRYTVVSAVKSPPLEESVNG